MMTTGHWTPTIRREYILRVVIVVVVVLQQYQIGSLILRVVIVVVVVVQQYKVLDWKSHITSMWLKAYCSPAPMHDVCKTITPLTQLSVFTIAHLTSTVCDLPAVATSTKYLVHSVAQGIVLS